MPGLEREVTAGQEVAVPGPFSAWPALKACAPDPSCAAHGVELLLALGWWPCLWGTLHEGQGAPCLWQQIALLALLLFHSSLPVASSQGRVFFSCLSGQGVNHPTLGGETGSSLAGSLPSSHNLPGHLRPASARGRAPALLPGWGLAWSLSPVPCIPCPLSLTLAAPQFLPVGSGPCLCFGCPALVIDAQLWLESLSLGKRMNRKGETDTLIKGTA